MVLYHSQARHHMINCSITKQQPQQFGLDIVTSNSVNNNKSFQHNLNNYYKKVYLASMGSEMRTWVKVKISEILNFRNSKLAVCLHTNKKLLSKELNGQLSIDIFK